MENKNIFQTWKNQMLNRPYDIPAAMTGKVEDDLVSIKKSMSRSGYATLLGVLSCIILIGMLIQIGIDMGRLTVIILLAVMTLIMIRGWWRSYEWKKAEIYSNTKDYLQLSAKSIRNYVKNLTYSYYGFYAFLIIANIMLFNRVNPGYDPKIFLGISVVIAVSWIRKYKLMKEKTALYAGVADKIEAVVTDLTTQY